MHEPVLSHFRPKCHLLQAALQRLPGTPDLPPGFLCAAGNRKPLAHHFPPEVRDCGDNTLMRHENVTIYTRGVSPHTSRYNIHKSLSCSLLEPPPVHGAWHRLAGAEQIPAEQMHQGRNEGAPWRTNAVLTPSRCHTEPNLCVAHSRCAGGLEAEPGVLKGAPPPTLLLVFT